MTKLEALTLLGLFLIVGLTAILMKSAWALLGWAAVCYIAFLVVGYEEDQPVNHE